MQTATVAGLWCQPAQPGQFGQGQGWNIKFGLDSILPSYKDKNRSRRMAHFWNTVGVDDFPQQNHSLRLRRLVFMMQPGIL